MSSATKVQMRHLALRKSVVSKMTQALLHVMQDIQKSYVENAARTLTWYHTQGQKLLRVIENPKEYLTTEQQVQNINPIDLLEKALSTSKDSMRKAARFARLYSSDDLKRVLNSRNEADPTYRLHWGHIVALISLNTVTERRQFEKMAIQELLSPPDLHIRIQKHCGGKRQQTEGRPFQVPGTLGGQVRQVKSFTGDWLKRNQNVWAGPKHNIFSNVISSPADRLTPEILDDLEEIADQLDEMEKAVAHDRKLVDRTIDHVREAIKRHGSSNGHAPVKKKKRLALVK